jgi:hypothetical protein
MRLPAFRFLYFFVVVIAFSFVIAGQPGPARSGRPGCKLDPAIYAEGKHNRICR